MRISSDPMGTNAPMSFLSDPEKLELIELYNSLPQGQKKAVLAFIRSMAHTETGLEMTT